MPKIKLDIVTVERTVLSEDVDFISAPGIDGVLGILPRHTPLMTALNEGELHYRKDGVEYDFAIGGGFVEVRPDHVIVLADSAERADEIDEQRAQAARERAERALKEKPRSDVEFARLERSLRRAEVRLKVAKRKRGAAHIAGPDESA
ncbi:MAG: F0F1 ATP synthase subunit epsilon [Chloroflexota bacterium]